MISSGVTSYERKFSTSACAEESKMEKGLGAKSGKNKAGTGSA